MGEFLWQAMAVDSYLSGMFIKSYIIENEEVNKKIIQKKKKINKLFIITKTKKK